jgi:glycerol-3-phosphate acyltransferase PlsY
MMQPEIVVAVAVVSYLLGSLSFSRLVTRWLTGQDVTEFQVPVAGGETRHRVAAIGANAASMRLGKKGGGIVGLLDILKVFAPTLVVRLLLSEQPYHLIAAVAGLAGHNWPIFYRFHGGAGFSAILGGLLAIDPLAALVLPFAGVLFGMAVLRNITAAFLSWMWLIIPWLWFSTFDPAHLAYAVAVNVLFVIAMIPEFRLMQRYKREGRLEEYGAASIEATPMGRGMLKIAAFFKLPPIRRN